MGLGRAGDEQNLETAAVDIGVGEGDAEALAEFVGSLDESMQRVGLENEAL